MWRQEENCDVKSEHRDDKLLPLIRACLSVDFVLPFRIAFSVNIRHVTPLLWHHDFSIDVITADPDWPSFCLVIACVKLWIFCIGSVLFVALTMVQHKQETAHVYHVPFWCCKTAKTASFLLYIDILHFIQKATFLPIVVSEHYFAVSFWRHGLNSSVFDCGRFYCQLRSALLLLSACLCKLGW